MTVNPASCHLFQHICTQIRWNFDQQGSSRIVARFSSIPLEHYQAKVPARFLNCRYRDLPAPLEPRHKNANSACDASRLSITRPAKPGRRSRLCRAVSASLSRAVDPPAEAAAAAAAASSVQGGRPGAVAAGGRPNLPSALSRPGGVGGRGGGGVRGSEGSRCGAAARGGGGGVGRARGGRPVERWWQRLPVDVRSRTCREIVDRNYYIIINVFTAREDREGMKGNIYTYIYITNYYMEKESNYFLIACLHPNFDSRKCYISVCCKF